MHGTGRLAADLNVEEDLVGYFRIRLDGRDGDEHKGGNEERRAKHFLCCGAAAMVSQPVTSVAGSTNCFIT